MNGSNLKTCSADPVSAVDEQLNRINDKVIGIASAMSSLASRLKPVLLPEQPEKGSASGGCAISASAPLTDHLGCQAYALSVIEDSIEGLIDRLEI